MLLRHIFGLVGMDANGGEDPVVSVGVGDGGVELLGAGAYTDGKQRVYTRRPRPCEHSVAVFGELREVDVRVGVDQIHGREFSNRFRKTFSSCGRRKKITQTRPSREEHGADTDVLANDVSRASLQDDNPHSACFMENGERKTTS